MIFLNDTILYLTIKYFNYFNFFDFYYLFFFFFDCSPSCSRFKRFQGPASIVPLFESSILEIRQEGR